jgi:hypothetical protein
LVHRRRFRQVPDSSFDLERLLETIIACDRGSAFRCRHEAGKNAHRGRFPGPVRAEKCQDFPFGDGKGDTVDSGVLAVTFRDVLNVNHRKRTLINMDGIGGDGGGCLSPFLYIQLSGILLRRGKAVNHSRVALQK